MVTATSPNDVDLDTREWFVPWAANSAYRLPSTAPVTIARARLEQCWRDLRAAKLHPCKHETTLQQIGRICLDLSPEAY
jgi:hypothetical protein